MFFTCSNFILVTLLIAFRLVKPGMNKDVSFYVRSARKAIIIDAAARAWAHGVPWEEALNITEKAMAAAGQGAKGKGKGKGIGKAKAKPKAKAKARA